MTINQLSFKDICNLLSVDCFHMHYDESDCVRTISNEKTYNTTREQLTSKFGNVEVSVNPGNFWCEKLKIEDKVWNKAHKAYCDGKAAWCAKYGCD